VDINTITFLANLWPPRAPIPLQSRDHVPENPLPKRPWRAVRFRVARPSER